MAVVKSPSAAVQAAHMRRAASAARRPARIQFFMERLKRVQIPMKSRVDIATEYLKSKVVRNISIPVVKVKGKRGGTIVVKRSKPGEYPRADTTHLMKTIFGQTREISPGVYHGYVGTPLHYGLILETSKRLRRSFLKRTLYEELPRLREMMTGPITT